MENSGRFFKIYANIPHAVRGSIIAVVDDETFTWNSAFLEIKGETDLGKKILNQLIKNRII